MTPASRGFQAQSADAGIPSSLFADPSEGSAGVIPSAGRQILVACVPVVSGARDWIEGESAGVGLVTDAEISRGLGAMGGRPSSGLGQQIKLKRSDVG